MAKQIGEDTKVTLDLKTIGMGAAGLAALIGMYFTLQADIALAKELPEPADPELYAEEVPYVIMVSGMLPNVT